jgi:hypothetical protein
MEPTSRIRRRSRRRRWFLGGLGTLGLLLAAGGWIGVRGYAAVRELELAVPLATALQAEVQQGDGPKVVDGARSLSEHTGNAAALTTDIVWRAAELVPWVGPNLTVLRELVAATDEVSRTAVMPLAELANAMSIDDLKPADSRLNLQPLVAAQPAAAAAAAALAESTAQVQEIDSSEVVPELAAAHHRFATLLGQASDAVDGLNHAVQLLPLMLGVDGPRNYVLLFQNSAELRASGGVSGALALVHTDGGSFSLERQASSADFPKFQSPVIELPIETRALYGENTAKYIQDVNVTPRFELSGQIAREMWHQRYGLEADGVLAVDPTALGYLLAATGPIRLDSGESVTSANAATLLLKDVYARYPLTSDQDAFFAEVTSKVFGALAQGAAEPKELLSALFKAGSESRVLIWSAHAGEQALLADTTLGGALPVSTQSAQGFGVYLNDATGAKMDTYLDVSLSSGAAVCRNDRLPNYEVEVTLANVAPLDAATSLPPYVAGIGEFGVAPGDILTRLTVYSTPGSFNLGVRRDRAPVDYQASPDGPYTLSKISVLLKPGESTVLTFRFLGGEPGAKPVVLSSTPLPEMSGQQRHAIDCEGGRAQ